MSSNMPSMAPDKDDVQRRNQNSNRRKSKSESSGGSGVLALIAMVVAIAASGAALLLWNQGEQLKAALDSSDQRIKSLESQLSSTGDEINQSDAAMRVQLNELGSEVAKLWDARKSSNSKIEAHDTSIRNLTTRTSKQSEESTNLAQQITASAAAIDELDEALATFDAKALSAAVERLASRQKDQEQSLSEVAQQAKENEEWLESVNAFRRQVNDRLNALQNPAPAAPQLQ